ncbi:phosphatidate cytidylyltransferase [Ramlibacter ginsenosidimutans]|uniref:Phosphatidate cytidylyltransferase n=1 Tax=Ramlibacter ginsenosidimutans TaxID=502333 RepID=A0A934TYH7_9BURK|nr:phosphatidate cytidylyltransferase [Ramlibacter ginsenosidimutans]MBK6009488.1 phosphatidate cytidylyltransferase [Ramlibacter ginsenosidimutans]
MNDFLRSLSPSQQVGMLFVTVFGLLALATIALLFANLREQRAPTDDAHVAQLQDFQQLLTTSWGMVVLFWLAWASGENLATFLFAAIAFFALREFITLSPTRRGDHRSLVLAFFVVLPIQFWLVATRHFDLFTVFIPVYVFLALPVASALSGDPHRFLERNAKLQWGIMVCVYGMSHVPALLLLQFPNRHYEGKQAFLVFFLVMVVQTCMLVQHLVTRRLSRPPSLPGISSSFHWRGWGWGVLAGSVLGGLLSFITPFKPGQALATAFIASVAGSLGHLVMKALKRDRGVTAWGLRGRSVTGANGLLDRVDALCFAAPIFFHSVRWYFGAAA